MQPPIRYATARDGVRIAFCTLGAGAPLVIPPAGPWAPIELEWKVPPWAGWYERLARRARVVRYDGRGTGLSDQSRLEQGLEARLLDLEAVVERSELRRIALLAPEHAGPLAIAYAARWPERVSHLLLWCAYARGADLFDAPQSRVLHDFMDQEWDLFAEAMAHARIGWSEGGLAHEVAALVRQCVRQEAVVAFDAIARQTDVTLLLGEVRAPTLVLHRRGLLYPSVDVARRLAAGIPDARLALLEGDSIAPFLGNTVSVLRAIDEFLGLGAAEGPTVTLAGRPPELVEMLSRREAEVLRLLGAGLSNQELADELVIAPGTVKTHLRNLYDKLGVRGRARAVVRARELHLLP